MEDFSVTDGRGDFPVFIHSELDDYGLTCVEFRVYARLARRAGQGGEARESVPKMAAAFGTSDRTIQRALKVLVNCRLVTEQPRPGKPNAYRLTPRAAWLPKAELEVVRAAVWNKGGDTTEGGQKSEGVTPETGVGVTPQPDEGTPTEGTPERETTRASFLPPWLPPKLWARWVAEQAQKGRPLTLERAKLQIRKLDALRARGTPVDVLVEHALERGWQSFYEVKGDNGNVNASGRQARPARQTYSDRNNDALAEIYPGLR